MKALSKWEPADGVKLADLNLYKKQFIYCCLIECSSRVIKNLKTLTLSYGEEESEEEAAKPAVQQSAEFDCTPPSQKWKSSTTPTVSPTLSVPRHESSQEPNDVNAEMLMCAAKKQHDKSLRKHWFNQWCGITRLMHARLEDSANHIGISVEKLRQLRRKQQQVQTKADDSDEMDIDLQTTIARSIGVTGHEPASSSGGDAAHTHRAAALESEREVMELRAAQTDRAAALERTLTDLRASLQETRAHRLELIESRAAHQRELSKLQAAHQRELQELHCRFMKSAAPARAQAKSSAEIPPEPAEPPDAMQASAEAAGEHQIPPEPAEPPDAMQASAGAAGEHPPCPYSEGDTPGEQRCWYEGCNYVNRADGTWVCLVNHTRRQHKASWRQYKGSFIGDQMRTEINRDQNDRNHRKKEQMSMQQTDDSQRSAASAQEERLQQQRRKSGGSNPERAAAGRSSGSGAAESMDRQQKQQQQQQQHKQEQPTERQQPTLEPYLRPGMTPELRSWKDQLPCVSIRPTYINHKGVPAKADGGNVLRASWPKEFKQDGKVKLDDFKMYLMNDLSKTEGEAKSVCLFIGRILGAMDCRKSQGLQMPALTSVEVWVAFCWHLLNDFMALPIMGRRYYWTQDMIAAMMKYSQFFIEKLQKKQLEQDDETFSKFEDTLQFAIGRMERFSASCAKPAKARLNAKYKEDARDIEGMPTKEQMQAALQLAYLDANELVQNWSDESVMSCRDKRLKLNDIMAAAIQLDTFGGRVKEWFEAQIEMIEEILDSGDDCLACANHKTSHQYGDVGKYISPGVRGMMQLYRQVPRPPGCTTFFVTASGGHMQFNHCLKRFAAAYFPADKVAPRVNLMRKWIHSYLVRATQTEQELKKLMVLVDKHSKAVQEKHYIIKDPRTDANLAKQIMLLVFPGGLVKWPSAAEVAAAMPGIRKRLYGTAAASAGEDGPGEDDEEEDELQYWAWGDLFGVREPLTPIPDATPAAGHDVLDDMLPVTDGTTTEQPVVNTASERCRLFARRIVASAAKEDTQPPAKRNSSQSVGAADVSVEPKRKKRTRVQDAAHDWIKEKLEAWQDANGVGRLAKPTESGWYVQKQRELLKAGLITEEHSQDVVRSYVKHLISLVERHMQEAQANASAEAQANAAAEAQANVAAE